MVSRKNRRSQVSAPRVSESGDPTSAACGFSSRIQEERFRALIEDVADGFYEVDLSGNFRFFNDALCRIFGYPRQAVQDRNYRDFMDASNARRAFDAFNRLFREGGGSADLVWEITHNDGKPRFLEVSAKLITDPAGQAVG